METRNSLLTSEWAVIEYNITQLHNALYEARKVSRASEMPESTQTHLQLLAMEVELWQANLSL